MYNITVSSQLKFQYGGDAIDNEWLLSEGQSFSFRDMATSWVSMPQWMTLHSNAYKQHELDLGWVVNRLKKKTPTTGGQELGREMGWSLSGIGGRTCGWML